MYDESLVTDNINLIYFVLKKMHLYNKIEEYYDVGMIGLCKAAKGFDPSKGYVFNTYASRCINSEILTYIRRKKANTRKANYNTISLNTIIYSNGEDSEITLENLLPSKINIEEEVIKKEQIKQLYIALSKLNERELDIISSLYGLNGVKQLTQMELKEKYNLSQAQISRIKNKSIDKLRKLLKEVK